MDTVAPAARAARTDSRASAAAEALIAGVMPVMWNHRAPEKIPLYHYKSGWDDYPSDVYYALLEGDDFLADVAIGRFDASTPEEMEKLPVATIRSRLLQLPAN